MPQRPVTLGILSLIHIFGVLSDEAVISYKRYPLLPFVERKALFENIRGVSRVVEQLSLIHIWWTRYCILKATGMHPIES